MNFIFPCTTFKKKALKMRVQFHEGWFWIANAKQGSLIKQKTTSAVKWLMMRLIKTFRTQFNTFTRVKSGAKSVHQDLKNKSGAPTDHRSSFKVKPPLLRQNQDETKCITVSRWKLCKWQQVWFKHQARFLVSIRPKIFTPTLQNNF
jgi:hypothetical protein